MFRKSEGVGKVEAVVVDFDNISRNKSDSLIFFEDEKKQYFCQDGIALYSVGTLVYKDRTFSDALSLIAADLQGGVKLKTVMNNTHGQFCCVITFCNSVFIVTDKLGSFPVYKYENSDEIIISNIFRTVLVPSKLSINYQALAEYVSFDYTFGETLFNEVEILKRGNIYHFSKKIGVTEYCNYIDTITFERYSQIEDIVESSLRIMKGNFRFVEHINNLFCDLTGGFDTRTIVSVIHDTGKKYRCGICGEQNLNETKIAREVARELDCAFETKIKIDSHESFLENLEYNYKCSAGIPIPFHSTELFNYYRTIKKKYDIHICGFAGSQLFDNWLPRLSLFSTKLSPDSMINKTLQFNDIFISSKITEKGFSSKLREKIGSVFNVIGTDRYDHISNFFTLSTFSKYYHGALIGAHNTIMPLYVPFLEADFARLMIETVYGLKNNRNIQRHILHAINRPVSRIMTTHGYDASVHGNNISEINKFKINMRNIQRRIFYSVPMLCKVNSVTKKFNRRRSKAVSLGELQRSFWLEEINTQWMNDMAIFDFIDRKKLSRYFETGFLVPKTKAKLLYINRLVNEFSPVS